MCFFMQTETEWYFSSADETFRNNKNYDLMKDVRLFVVDKLTITIIFITEKYIIQDGGDFANVSYS